MFSIRRGLAAVAAVAVVAAVLPSPAAAAPAAGLFAFSVPDMGVSAAGKTRTMSLKALDGAPKRLTGVKLVIDASAVAGFARAWVPDFSGEQPKPSGKCTVAGAVTTCAFGTRTEFDGFMLPFLTVNAKDGAETGLAGKLSLTLSANEIEPLTATPTVTVSDAVDLVAGPKTRPVHTLKPGELIDGPLEIRNAGIKPVKGVLLRLVGNGRNVIMFHNRLNCWYTERYDESVCEFWNTLEPGKTYRVEPESLRVGHDAVPGRYAYLHQWWTLDDANELGPTFLGRDRMTKGSKPLSLLREVPAAGVAARGVTDPQSDNNIAFGTVVVPGGSAPTATPTSGATPAPGPTATVSPSATPSTSVEPTPGPTVPATTAPAAGGGGGDGGGDLPLTGANVAVVGGAGVLLLAGGLVAYLLARRRRTSFTA